MKFAENEICHGIINDIVAEIEERNRIAEDIILETIENLFVSDIISTMALVTNATAESNEEPLKIVNESLEADSTGCDMVLPVENDVDIDENDEQIGDDTALE